MSGGPDSLALALLADRWARQHGGQLRALTVDHRLRPESADEARTVAGWLAARGIPHAILVWAGAKPRSGIQQAAREARYRLLGEWCRANGVLHLLTAHHHADQVETHLMRRRAGSGIDGLAGMSAVRELPGCRLVRPLLAVPPERLEALLAAENQPFVRDPSNRDPGFERTRVRAAARALDAVARAGVDAELRDCAGQRIAREHAVAALMARAVSIHPGGFAALDAAALADADAATVERLLGLVARSIGGGVYAPRRERVARLRASLAAAPGRARTLGGCRFVPWRERLLVLRELGAASPPVALKPDVAMLWDRRFEVVSGHAADGLTLGYLGQSGGKLADDCGRSVPRLVHAVLPALWDQQGLAAVPHLGWRRPASAAAPRLVLRPASGLTQAGFTVV